MVRQGRTWTELEVSGEAGQRTGPVCLVPRRDRPK